MPFIETLLRPYVAAIQSVPVASFIVIAFLWLSARRLSTFIAFLMVFPVLYTNLLQGIRAADRNLLEMADVFRLSPGRRVRCIFLPALRPALFAGCRVALGLCWKAGVAAEVIGVDASQLGVDQAAKNAALNGLSDRVEFLCADVFALLPELEAKGQKFDLVILDPPAFTKSRASVKKAVTGYREINLRAMKLIRDGGFLATCSCSHFMSDTLFCQMLKSAARDAAVSLRQIEARQQAPDHPVLWNVPETEYFKFYLFQVV